MAVAACENALRFKEEDNPPWAKQEEKGQRKRERREVYSGVAGDGSGAAPAGAGTGERGVVADHDNNDEGASAED